MSSSCARRTRAKNEIHAVLVRRLVGPPARHRRVRDQGPPRGSTTLELPVEESETVEACPRHIEFLDAEIAAVERQIATARARHHRRSGG